MTRFRHALATTLAYTMFIASVGFIIGTALWAAARTDCYRHDLDPLGPLCRAVTRVEP